VADVCPRKFWGTAERDQRILEASSNKYLGFILRSYLSWERKALQFVVRVLKKGSSNMKSLTYTSLVSPVLECGASCWDPYREGQINMLDCV
jgi:hypothetical protein